MTLPLSDLTEREFSQQVYDLCALLEFKRYHTWRSKHSPAGYPDETLVRERVVWLELKTAKGKLSPFQKDWIRALLEANAEVYLVRPRDLDALAAVLAWRGDPLAVGAIRARDQLRAQTRAEVTA